MDAKFRFKKFCLTATLSLVMILGETGIADFRFSGDNWGKLCAGSYTMHEKLDSDPALQFTYSTFIGGNSLASSTSSKNRYTLICLAVPGR